MSKHGEGASHLVIVKIEGVPVGTPNLGPLAHKLKKAVSAELTVDIDQVEVFIPADMVAGVLHGRIVVSIEQHIRGMTSLKEPNNTEKKHLTAQILGLIEEFVHEQLPKPPRKVHVL